MSGVSGGFVVGFGCEASILPGSPSWSCFVSFPGFLRLFLVLVLASGFRGGSPRCLHRNTAD